MTDTVITLQIAILSLGDSMTPGILPLGILSKGTYDEIETPLVWSSAGMKHLTYL